MDWRLACQPSARQRSGGGGCGRPWRDHTPGEGEVRWAGGVWRLFVVLAGDAADGDVVSCADGNDGKAGLVEARLSRIDQGGTQLAFERVKLSHRRCVLEGVVAFLERGQRVPECGDEIVVSVFYFGGRVELGSPVKDFRRDARERRDSFQDQGKVSFILKEGLIVHVLREQRLEDFLELRVDVVVDGGELREVLVEGEGVLVAAAAGCQYGDGQETCC